MSPARFFIPLLIPALLGGARAQVVGPYSPDAATLHLWHCDETAVPVANAAVTSGVPLAVLGGGATLGHTGFSGFGKALGTVDGGANVAPGNGTDAYLAAATLASSAADNVTASFMDPVSGAFTMEVMVRLDFNPLTAQPLRNSTMQMLSGDQDGTGGGVRSFQLRLVPVGVIPNTDGFTTALTAPALEFINIRNGTGVENKIVVLPTAGLHAVAQGVWFHLAVTYDGNGSLKYYWTRVDSGGLHRQPRGHQDACQRPASRCHRSRGRPDRQGAVPDQFRGTHRRSPDQFHRPRRRRLHFQHRRFRQRRVAGLVGTILVPGSGRGCRGRS